MIGRREFIALLGGAAAGWPLAARAQQRPGVRRLGALTGIADETAMHARYAVFRHVLAQLGWNPRAATSGSTIAGVAAAPMTFAKTRWNWPALAPEVILVSGGASVAMLLQATRTVPLVFVPRPRSRRRRHRREFVATGR